MSYSPRALDGPYETVFDVGAFRGDFARACLAEWPDVVTHSFEPLEPTPLDVAVFPRWFWHTCAIGNECDVVVIHRNVFVPSSSMLPMAELHEEAFPYTKGSEEVKVGMVTLEEMSELIIERALLKIDVQGFELEVLKGAGEFITAFRAVVLEVSHETLYHGAPTPEELCAWLDAHGFTYSKRVDELKHPRGGELLQSDELWVRL